MAVEAQPGGQCPHGYPIHISTECTECKAAKSEPAELEDLSSEVLEEKQNEEESIAMRETIPASTAEAVKSRRGPSEMIRSAASALRKELGIDAKEKVATESVENINERLETLNSLISAEAEDRKEQIENIKNELRNIMAEIHNLYKTIDPAEEHNHETYSLLKSHLDAVLTVKSKADKLSSQAFSEIFYEFSDFIDDALVHNYIDYKRSQQMEVSAEGATQEIYGRSKEEVEEIKSKNRVEVAKKIEELAEKPYVDLADIEALHALNNKSIVPEDFSRIRSGKGDNIIFGQRVGLLPRDVGPEMQGVVDRMNELFDKKALGMSKAQYELQAAKLHNDMLDIHPFKDRNGSTSLMVLELMMTREGYEPPAERDKDYYRSLRKMLNNNVAAIGAVGYEQYCIKYKPGYFASERIISDKEKKGFYDNVIKVIQKARKRQEKEAKKQ